eukprot:356351-Chlamydomonas_euryale.AAC.6
MRQLPRRRAARQQLRGSCRKPRHQQTPTQRSSSGCRAIEQLVWRHPVNTHADRVARGVGQPHILSGLILRKNRADTCTAPELAAAAAPAALHTTVAAAAAASYAAAAVAAAAALYEVATPAVASAVVCAAAAAAADSSGALYEAVATAVEYVAVTSSANAVTAAAAAGRLLRHSVAAIAATGAALQCGAIAATGAALQFGVAVVGDATTDVISAVTDAMLFFLPVTAAVAAVAASAWDKAAAASAPAVDLEAAAALAFPADLEAVAASAIAADASTAKPAAATVRTAAAALPALRRSRQDVGAACSLTVLVCRRNVNHPSCGHTRLRDGMPSGRGRKALKRILQPTHVVRRLPDCWRHLHVRRGRYLAGIWPVSGRYLATRPPLVTSWCQHRMWRRQLLTRWR